jgi:hypothetical protein
VLTGKAEVGAAPSPDLLPVDGPQDQPGSDLGRGAGGADLAKTYTACRKVAQVISTIAKAAPAKSEAVFLLVNGASQYHVVGYLAELAVRGLALGPEQLERLMFVHAVTGHEDAHRRADAAAGDQRDLKIGDPGAFQDAFRF